MKDRDYKILIEKEYEKNKKNIFTCYFFLILSVVLFALFFLYMSELPVFGAALLLDIAAGAYAFRAFKGLHPYWEMQLALQVIKIPDETSVFRFAAGLEYALEHGLPAFKGRSLEIFDEAFTAVQREKNVSVDAKEKLEAVIKEIRSI